MKYITLLLCFLAITISDKAHSRTKLQLEIDKYNIAIAKRDKAIRVNMQKLETLRVEQVKVNVADPSTHFENNSVPLKCALKKFRWKGKLKTHQYKECEYTYNSASTVEVGQLYAAIQLLLGDGWEIDKNELYKQDINSPTRIKNIDRYRYKRIKQE